MGVAPIIYIMLHTSTKVLFTLEAKGHAYWIIFSRFCPRFEKGNFLCIYMYKNIVQGCWLDFKSLAESNVRACAYVCTCVHDEGYIHLLEYNMLLNGKGLKRQFAVHIHVQNAVHESQKHLLVLVLLVQATVQLAGRFHGHDKGIIPY